MTTLKRFGAHVEQRAGPPPLRRADLHRTEESVRVEGSRTRRLVAMTNQIIKETRSTGLEYTPCLTGYRFNVGRAYLAGKEGSDLTCSSGLGGWRAGVGRKAASQEAGRHQREAMSKLAAAPSWISFIVRLNRRAISESEVRF